MDIDAVGTFAASRAAFPALAKSPKGCIINISATLHYGATWWQVCPLVQADSLGYQGAAGSSAPAYDITRFDLEHSD